MFWDMKKDRLIVLNALELEQVTFFQDDHEHGQSDNAEVIGEPRARSILGPGQQACS